MVQTIACNEERAFSISDEYKNYKWLVRSCQTFVKPLFIFWILFLLDVELSVIEKLE